MKRIKSIIILAIISVLLTLTSTNFNYIIINNQNLLYDSQLTSDKDLLQVSETSEKIHINNNWTEAITEGICTGSGIFSDPYLIENLQIDTEDSGTCILIENSDAYFIIENCTLDSGDSYPSTGIRLNNVTKGTLVNNNCSFSYMGIGLFHCNKITISENILNHDRYGIYLSVCNDCNVSGNSANSTYFSGIELLHSNNATITENIMNNSGLVISGEIEHLNSHDIDTTNLVNGKPLYYYKNEVDLGPDDFLDPGQVILINCNDSLISNLDISNTSLPISLYYCSNNTVAENTGNYNRNGVQFFFCRNTTITGNNVSIYLFFCSNNTITENIANTNGYYGIMLRFCNDSIILKNVANENDYGVYLYSCLNNNILENTANNNSYYGIYLEYSDSNLISKNIANYNSYHGIYLSLSDHNAITGNTANYNSYYGISLLLSNYNTITGNILIGNGECIHEDRCTGNTFSDNGDCTYGQIPIELIILISVLSGGGVIGIVTFLLIRWKKRR
jgi:parallel beta-helix repeat protein